MPTEWHKSTKYTLIPPPRKSTCRLWLVRHGVAAQFHFPSLCSARGSLRKTRRESCLHTFDFSFLPSPRPASTLAFFFFLLAAVHASCRNLRDDTLHHPREANARHSLENKMSSNRGKEMSIIFSFCFLRLPAPQPTNRALLTLLHLER